MNPKMDYITALETIPANFYWNAVARQNFCRAYCNQEYRDIAQEHTNESCAYSSFQVARRHYQARAGIK